MPLAVPGGFVGVDIFFVISGYLITRILLRELSTTGSISLAGFWARRAWRILPAATIVLVATAIATALVMPSMEQVELGTSVQAAARFVENWRLISQELTISAVKRSPPLLCITGRWLSRNSNERYALPRVGRAAAHGGCLLPDCLRRR
jgi:peptidoglycan/LPS O-acetylase OafA/YrhL